MFVGTIPGKPSRDFTRLLRNTKRFKRLVAYAKCNRTSHKSWIYLFVAHLVFSCVLLRD
jgi:hypothetical protein